MVTLLSLLLTLLPQGPATATPKAADLAWLNGCWELTRGTRHVLEQWMAPEGATLLGMSRTVSGGKTLEWEFLMIREGAAGLEYVARPSGQAEAIFTSTKVTADEVVFENPQHDFPTRISYARQPDGGLV